MQMFRTIAGAESTLLAFHDDGAVAVAMTEAPHKPLLRSRARTSPTRWPHPGGGVAAWLREGDKARVASRVVYDRLEAVSDGVRTADLGGPASTTEFTDKVIRRVRTKIEVVSPPH